MKKKNKILVVVDMQNDFITGPLGSKMAQAIVPNVIEKLEDSMNNSLIFFTLDQHDNDYYLESEEGKNLPVEHCIIGTEGLEVIPELKEYELCSLAFTKPTFGSLKMCEFLVNRQLELDISYDEIELIGVCTDICVIANAIICKTACPDAHIVVDAACCAGVTPESHDDAIKAMKALQIEIRNEGKEPWR